MHRSTSTHGHVLLLSLVAAFLIGSLSGCDTVARQVQQLSSGTGGTLQLAGATPETLDPAMVQDVQSTAYVLEIFSGLVRLNGHLNVEPDLASAWDVSSDGRTYSFHLRPDAKFQDGRRVTADDFKYSIERALDPSLSSPVAQTYLGDIVGSTERLAGSTSSVAGVVAEAPDLLRITIDSPKSFFLAKLTYPTSFVLDRQNVSAGSNWFVKPNGTGPFKLTNFTPNEKIVLTRNPSYYGPAPTLAEVDYYLGSQSPMSLYQAGKIDVASLGPGDVQRATDPEGPFHSYLTQTPLMSLWYIGFDVRQKPFDDRHVRRAFALATDRASLINSLYRGARTPASGIIPPGLDGSDPHFQGLLFDPRLARDELAASTYGSAQSLPSITLSVTSSSSATAAAIASMYSKNLGINVKVEILENSFFADLRDHRVQMFYLGWIADYPDPQNFVDILFRGRSQGNHTQYANPDVDGVLQQAGAEPDQSRRDALYRQAQQTIVDDAPAIPVLYETDYVLVRPSVVGLTITPLGILSFAGVKIQR